VGVHADCSSLTAPSCSCGILLVFRRVAEEEKKSPHPPQHFDTKTILYISVASTEA